MIKCTETPTFIRHYAVPRSELDDLECKLSDLMQVKGTSKERRKIKDLIRTRENQLAHGLDSFTKHERLCMFIETFGQIDRMIGGVWTPAEAALLGTHDKSYEGNAEKALKLRLGIPLNASLCGMDLPDGDVKFFGPSVESFRTGKLGKRLFIRCLKNIPDEFITEKMLDAEVGSELLREGRDIHPIARKIMYEQLKPSVGLSCYPSLYLANSHGFVKIFEHEYDQAFELACITQGAPKYALDMDYVLARLLLTLKKVPNVVPEEGFTELPAKDLPDGITVDGVGHV